MTTVSEPVADPLAGTLPPWPDNPSADPGTTARALLDDQLVDLEEQLTGLTEDADPELQNTLRAFFDLHGRRVRAADAVLRERGEVLTRVQAALARLPRQEADACISPYRCNSVASGGCPPGSGLCRPRTRFDPSHV